MSINLNLNIFRSSGDPHSMRIFEFRDGDQVAIPDGSIVLYVEHIPDGDYLEVWAAVPDKSILSSTKHEIDDDEIPVSSRRGTNLLDRNDVSDLPPPKAVRIEDLAVEEVGDGEAVFFLGDDLIDDEDPDG